MKCLECGTELAWLDNAHLLDCSGITVHEYAIRHHRPLDLLLHPDQVGVDEAPVLLPRRGARAGEAARSTLQGLRWAGLVDVHDGVVEVRGEVRRLDLLLWDLAQLGDYGFRFVQRYRYADDSHRVVARNLLQAAAANLRRDRVEVCAEPPPAFLDSLAVYVAHQAEWQAGYLFMQFQHARHGDEVRVALARDHGVRCEVLDAADCPDGLLLRTASPDDTPRLLTLLESRLRVMPGIWQRFHDETPVVTVSKELVFDAAHFITDHPAKCSNLHGGRYVLQVQVRGRIDPMTGCVVDYGYLKRVVNRLVVDRFDHHTLNYAAAELAWRSSTEMLCVYIWERLLPYLPGLAGLRLYETTQSWCDYTGPDLASLEASGSSALFTHFAEPPLDLARRRSLLTGVPRRAAASEPCQ
jgi:6-pyruvoyl tetrahydropterin synthase/QueD family protein